MNFKLLLAILLFFPFVAKAQDVAPTDSIAAVDSTKVTSRGGVSTRATDDSAIVFTNIGQIFFKEKSGLAVGASDDEKLVMNIQGSALFLNAKTATGTEILTGELKSDGAVGLSLTGDWVADLSARTGVAPATYKTGFDLSGSSDADKKAFVKFNSETTANDYPIYDATFFSAPEAVVGILAPAVDDEVELSIPGSTAAEDLTLRKKQTIRSYNKDTDRLTAIRPRIVLPNIVVEELSSVALNYLTDLEVGQRIVGSENYPGVSATGEGNIVVKPGGMFSVEARALTAEENNILVSNNVPRLMGIPSLYFSSIKNSEVKNALGGRPYTGQVMYDLQLFDKKTGTNIITPAGGTDKAIVELTPFSSPYKKLGTDYMLFNILTKPTRYSVAGEAGPITDHKRSLFQGEAYFIAQNTGDFDYEEIARKTGAHPNNRAYGGYQFNREYYLSRKNKFDQVSAHGLNSQTEVFQSPKESVSVELWDGLNFIANPYLHSVSLDDLTKDYGNGGNPSEQILANWTPAVTQGTPSQVTVGKDRNSILRNKFWFPHSASIQWIVKGGVNYFKYKVQYFDRQHSGGTADVSAIGPLQVFAVEASEKTAELAMAGTPVKLQLPYNKIGTLLSEEIATPRGGVKEADDEERVDEILLQTEILDQSAEATRSTTGRGNVLALDRVSFVLRENASLSGSDAYDSQKPIIMAEESGVNGNSQKLGVRALDDSQSNVFGGLLYTKTLQNQPLMTSVIPTSTKRVPVYFTPMEKESKVLLTVKRMESLQTISRAWLIDRFEDNKVIELHPDTEYEFVSKPLSKELAATNRFELVLGDAPDDDTPSLEEEDPIEIVYNSPVLYLSKLTEKDRNSDVQIFDLQGRLILRSKVVDIPVMSYSKPLSLGTYIVKVSGKRNYTTKFLVLPQ